MNTLTLRFISLITAGAVCLSLGAEAVRVVKSAPKWKPARYDGVPVRLTAYVTVVFD